MKKFSLFLLSALLLAACSTESPLTTTPNETLSANINTFMEVEADSVTDSICSNHLYGYDEEYAYAWVLCESFIEKDGEWFMSSGSSVPTRFEYSGEGFEIFSYEEPRDGTEYAPSIEELFPASISTEILAQSGQDLTPALDTEIRSQLSFEGPLEYVLTDTFEVLRSNLDSLEWLTASTDPVCQSIAADFKDVPVMEYNFLADALEWRLLSKWFDNCNSVALW